MVVVFLVRIAGGQHFTASVFPSIILIIVAGAGLLVDPATLLWVRLLLLLHPEIVSIERVSKVLLLVMSIAVLLVLILVPNHKRSTVRLWVNGMSNTFHNRLETVPFIGLILNVALGAVGFIQSVATLQTVPVADFPLALVVPGMGILDAIFKLVLCIGVPIVRVFVASQARCYQACRQDGDLEDK